MNRNKQATFPYIKPEIICDQDGRTFLLKIRLASVTEEGGVEEGVGGGQSDRNEGRRGQEMRAGSSFNRSWTTASNKTIPTLSSRRGLSASTSTRVSKVEGTWKKNKKRGCSSSSAEEAETENRFRLDQNIRSVNQGTLMSSRLAKSQAQEERDECLPFSRQSIRTMSQEPRVHPSYICIPFSNRNIQQQLQYFSEQQVKDGSHDIPVRNSWSDSRCIPPPPATQAPVPHLPTPPPPTQRYEGQSHSDTSKSFQFIPPPTYTAPGHSHSAVPQFNVQGQQRVVRKSNFDPTESLKFNPPQFSAPLPHSSFQSAPPPQQHGARNSVLGGTESFEFIPSTSSTAADAALDQLSLLLLPKPNFQQQRHEEFRRQSIPESTKPIEFIPSAISIHSQSQSAPPQLQQHRVRQSIPNGQFVSPIPLEPTSPVQPHQHHARQSIFNNVSKPNEFIPSVKPTLALLSQQSESRLPQFFLQPLDASETSREANAFEFITPSTITLHPSSALPQFTSLPEEREAHESLPDVVASNFFEVSSTPSTSDLPQLSTLSFPQFTIQPQQQEGRESFYDASKSIEFSLRPSLSTHASVIGSYEPKHESRQSVPSSTKLAIPPSPSLLSPFVQSKSQFGFHEEPTPNPTKSVCIPSPRTLVSPLPVSKSKATLQPQTSESSLSFIQNSTFVVSIPSERSANVSSMLLTTKSSLTLGMKVPDPANMVIRPSLKTKECFPYSASSEECPCSPEGCVCIPEEASSSSSYTSSIYCEEDEEAEDDEAEDEEAEDDEAEYEEAAEEEVDPEIDARSQLILKADDKVVDLDAELQHRQKKETVSEIPGNQIFSEADGEELDGADTYCELLPETDSEEDDEADADCQLDEIENKSENEFQLFREVDDDKEVDSEIKVEYEIPLEDADDDLNSVLEDVEERQALEADAYNFKFGNPEDFPGDGSRGFPSPEESTSRLSVRLQVKQGRSTITYGMPQACQFQLSQPLRAVQRDRGCQTYGTQFASFSQQTAVCAGHSDASRRYIQPQSHSYVQPSCLNFQEERRRQIQLPRVVPQACVYSPPPPMPSLYSGPPLPYPRVCVHPTPPIQQLHPHACQLPLPNTDKCRTDRRY